MRNVATATNPIRLPRDVGDHAAEADRTEHLIAASGVVASDRVLVFGYEILSHLACLARRGIRSAAGVHAGYAYRSREPVDIVWFTRVSDIEAEVTRLLGGIGNPRLVAVELMEPVEFGQLRHLVRCLRAKGLRQTDYYKAANLSVVAAWQPSRRRAQGAEYRGPSGGKNLGTPA